MTGEGLKGGGAPRGGSRRRPWLIVGVSVVATSLAVASALVSGVAGSGSSRPVTQSSAPFPRSPASGASQPVSTHLTAADVLDRAAAVALRQPDVRPRPDQFAYWEEASSGYGIMETWRSIDGSRNGFVLTDGQKDMIWGCQHGWQTIQPDPGSGVKSLTQQCTQTPAYLPAMPTSAAGLESFIAATFLRQRGANAKVSPDVLPKVVQLIFSQYYVAPRQQAGLYRFFATLPGLSLISHVTDALGRPAMGVAIAGTGQPGTVLVFNPQTFGYEGYLDLDAHGKVSDYAAVITTAIVNQARPAPCGSLT